MDTLLNEISSYSGGAKRRRRNSPRRRASPRVVYRPTIEEEIAELVIRDKLYRPVVKKVYKKPLPSKPVPSAPITIGGKKKRSSPKKKRSTKRSPKRVYTRPVIQDELILSYRPVIRKVYIPSQPTPTPTPAPTPVQKIVKKPTAQIAIQTPPQTGQMSIQTEPHTHQIGV